MSKCKSCGDKLPKKHNKKEKLCEFCIEAKKLAKEVNATRPASNSNPRIRVPVFDKLTSVDGLKVGDFVYQKSTMFSDSVSRRRFSSKYKILKIKDNFLTVLRVMDRKVPYKIWEYTDDVTKFLVQTGSELIDDSSGDFGS